MPEYPKLITRKIKYNSPSGYVNIGKYQPPFERVIKGFGYMGVILEDCESGKLQCHICGKWYEQMPRHIEIHDLNSQEYKIRFGLLISTALKSKKMRLRQSAIMQKLRGKNKANRFSFKKGNKFSGNRKNKPKALESRNRYGVCDLQIMERINRLRNILNKTPTLTELKDEYGNTFITNLHSRYSSYVKLCSEMGMEPNFSNYYPKYSKRYFIEKALSNEASIRIFTVNEGRAFYKYFKSIKELREIIMKIKKENGL
jgi:hypothetical protein